MQVYNKFVEKKQFTQILQAIRNLRKFNTQQYIDIKTKIINDYFSKNGLDTAVVAVSGGLDSACALALIKQSSIQYKSPIKHIIPITLPLLNRTGATNQTQTISKAQELCSNLGLELHTMHIGEGFDKISIEVNEKLNKNSDKNAWALGQLTAYTRTPYLYYSTSVLTAQGKRSIIIGTTNRDEGAYLGYVGKASDAMVDLQIISDLHKSEVLKVCEFLNVPQSILKAVPTGDMYDQRTDEDVFGASYDFVEIYINYLNMSSKTQEYLLSIMNEEEKNIFLEMQNNIENLHRYNRHKYYSGSQAVHLDIMQSATKGGWIDMVHSTPHKADLKELNKPIMTHQFSGFVASSPNIHAELFHPINEEIHDLRNEKTIHVLNNIISKEASHAVEKWFDAHKANTQATNPFGVKITNTEKIAGSQRLSFYSEELAQELFEKIIIQSSIENIFIKPDNSTQQFTNFGEQNTFRLVGINPMFRVIQYKESDFLVPHYDDAWIKNKYQRSLKTLIIGITPDNMCEGGETDFLVDEQDTLAYEERNFTDKDELDFNIDKSFKIQPGQALVFDHRILHHGRKIQSGVKTIIRTEVIYESCDFLRT